MSTFSNLINSNSLVLVDFYAEWCGPCKTMAPILKQVKANVGDSVKVVKVDVDKNGTLAQNLSIRSVPTLKLFKNGEEVWSGAGVVQMSKLTELIQYYSS